MPWDKFSLAAITSSCMVEEESTLFNLTSIRGPYYVVLDFDNDANGIKENLEVHFCNPVRQKE